MFDTLNNFISGLFSNTTVLPPIFFAIITATFIYSVFIRNLMRLVSTTSFIKYSDIVYTVLCSITVYFTLKGGV